jgi:hypothetical protein
MQMRARLSNDHGWRQNRHDHHKGRARILTSGRVSPQLNAHSPRLCRHPGTMVSAFYCDAVSSLSEPDAAPLAEEGRGRITRKRA